MLRALVRLNNFKLRDKMLLSYVVFMLLPQVLLGLLVVSEFRAATLREALAQAEEGVTRLERQTQEVLDVSRRLSDRIASDTGVERFLIAPYGDVLQVFQAYHDFDTFQLYRDITPEITGIQAYVDNPALLDNWEVRPLTDDVRGQFWYRAARARPNTSGWFSWSDETKAGTARLSLVRTLPYASEGHEGALVIDLDTGRIDALLGQAGFETLVLDANRVVVASSRPELAGKPLTDARLLSLADTPTGSSERTYEGTAARVFVRDLTPGGAFNGLRIVGVVSPGVILGPADRVSVFGLLVIVGAALVSLVFLWTVYTLFARRLEALSRQLPLVGAGDFDQVLHVDGTDEIGRLAARFNSMVRDVRSLVAEVRESHDAQNRLERAQGEIRLKMLASQINPHFLFNVLESIRMKAHLKGEREIANTVKLLGHLMRRNLGASGGPIPLGEELENVRGYLEIEKFRLEEKLEYRIEAGPGAEAVLVPPLIVEPLVENAVVHGLERRYGGGKVVVTARLEGTELVVAVEDNGLGMTEERRRLLLEGPEGRHVGLKNIHQRLLLTYGDSAGLVIESREGEGTTVRFRVPGAG